MSRHRSDRWADPDLLKTALISVVQAGTGLGFLPCQTGFVTNAWTCFGQALYAHNVRSTKHCQRLEVVVAAQECETFLFSFALKRKQTSLTQLILSSLVSHRYESSFPSRNSWCWAKCQRRCNIKQVGNCLQLFHPSSSACPFSFLPFGLPCKRINPCMLRNCATSACISNQVT